MAQATKLILASTSPRRRELLGLAGVEFEVIESGVAEVRRESESADGYALRMARAKALAVSASVPDRLALAADTVVELDGQILEKPDNAAEARRMLKALSGRTHVVVTAFAIARNGSLLESAPVISRVTFRALDDHEIDAYIASGEPFDKAGAYGIQGRGADFIAHVEGPRDNVMGLPMREVLEALGRHGYSPRAVGR
jgi:nucleoside triphosphate pyrophosphatase